MDTESFEQIAIPERDYGKLSTLDAAVAYLLDAQTRGAGAST